MTKSLQHGNFTNLAANYHNRPGYSPLVLKTLLALHDTEKSKLRLADVGAGTGKLTKQLNELGVGSVVAVEPNDSMREEGIKYTDGLGVKWIKGSGEITNLPDASVDGLLMASAFHWVKLAEGLAEFRRVLRPGGMFTALWNPRDLERAPLQAKIDTRIKEMVPELKRVSSGGPTSAQDWFSLLTSTNQFRDVLFLEAKHEEVMTPERYMGIWHSVNDIQVQAGPERWRQILEMIEAEISGLNEIRAAYSTRAWTVWRVD